LDPGVETVPKQNRVLSAIQRTLARKTEAASTTHGPRYKQLCRLIFNKKSISSSFFLKKSSKFDAKFNFFFS
jgi:hypothetical protein